MFTLRWGGGALFCVLYIFVTAPPASTNRQWPPLALHHWPGSRSPPPAVAAAARRRSRRAGSRARTGARYGAFLHFLLAACRPDPLACNTTPQTYQLVELPIDYLPSAMFLFIDMPKPKRKAKCRIVPYWSERPHKPSKMQSVSHDLSNYERLGYFTNVYSHFSSQSGKKFQHSALSKRPHERPKHAKRLTKRVEIWKFGVYLKLFTQVASRSAKPNTG